ncbi:MAG: hypothetical protein WDM76_08640 [Limisphaerales bacterium]
MTELKNLQLKLEAGANKHAEFSKEAKAFCEKAVSAILKFEAEITKNKPRKCLLIS